MNKFNVYPLFVLAISLIIISAINELKAQNDSLKPTAKTRIENFNAIDVSSWANVAISQTGECGVNIKGNVSEGNAIKAIVKKGKLMISGGMPDNNAVVYVTCRNISSISCSGAGASVKSGELVSDKLSIRISGISRVDLNIKAKMLNVRQSGASSAILKGKAHKQNLKVSGASQLNASELITDNTHLEVSGASSVKVNAGDTLSGIVTGASNIAYLQKPAFINVKVAGVSKIDMVNPAEIIIPDSISRFEIPDTTEINEPPDSIENTNINIGKDTVKVRVGKKNILIIKDKEGNNNETIIEDDEKKIEKKKTDKHQLYWGGFGLGINGYLLDSKASLPDKYNFLDLKYAKSVSVNINIFEQGIKLVKNHLYIVTGIGYEINNYRLAKNSVLLHDAPFIDKINVDKDSISFSKNKFSVSWVNIPLLLQFDTKPLHKKSTLHFSAGITGGIRVNSHTKQVYSIDGKTYKPKSHDDFNQPLLKYSAMFRIGYGKLDLFASYQLNSMFKSGEGPDLHPFNIGINLIGF